MKNRFFISMMLAAASCLLLEAGTAGADVYMKQRRHTGPMNVMGQERPAEDVVEEIWITPAGFRNDSRDSSTIMLLDRKEMITIDHAEKSYTRMPMNLGEQMKQQTRGEHASEAEAFQALMQNMMKMEVDVRPKGEKKKIGAWNCEGYTVTLSTVMGPTTSEVWATQDLKMDPALQDRYTSSIAAAMPGMQQSMGRFMEEMKKIKGVQVLNVSTAKMMNHSFTTETRLLEFKNAKAPGDLFALPSGYSEKGL